MNTINAISARTKATHRCRVWCALCLLSALTVQIADLRAGESAAINMRNIADAERWQTQFDAKPLTWHWPEGAVRAELTVTNVATQKESRYEIAREGAAIEGSFSVPELASTEAGERLFDVAVTFSDGTATAGDQLSARIAILPEQIDVPLVASRKFKNVKGPDRLVFCKGEGGALVLTPSDGVPVTVESPVRAGYSAVNVGRFVPTGSYFTLSEDSGLVSELLRYMCGGLMIILY